MFYNFFNKDKEHESVRTVFFEVLSRIQNSLVRVYESNENNVTPGSIEFYQNIKNLDGVKFTNARESSKIISSKFSGSLTPLLLGNALEFMSDLVFNTTVNNSKPNSALAKVILGSNVLESDIINLKEVTKTQKKDKSKKSTTSGSNLFKIEDIEDNLQTETEDSKILEDLDFDSLFSLDLDTKEDEEETLSNTIETDSISLTKHNRFGEDEDEDEEIEL